MPRHTTLPRTGTRRAFLPWKPLRQLCWLIALAWLAPWLRADYPIASHRYLADPAALVSNGRVYLYCSNDDENAVDGGYVMKSLVCVSSSDLKNWTDHGIVFRVPANASWASYAWAPAIVARNGNFYLYFGNNASGIGVASSTSPTGPFTDVKGGYLINSSTSGVLPATNMWIFDPGVFIDDDGQAYLYFGGNGPTNARVIKLNSDMISTSGSAVTISTPNFFEAAWVHKRNGLYYFSYSNNPSSGLNIDYLTSTDPMSGFTYRGTVAGQPPSNHNNNHHAIFTLNGAWYHAYHNRAVATQAGIPTTYRRNLGLERLNYNSDGTIQQIAYTTDGVTSLANFNPYVRVEAETLNAQSGIQTEPCSEGGMNVRFAQEGTWTKIKGVDFGSMGANGFSARVASASSGGSIEIHLGSPTGPLVGTCNASGTGDWQTWTTQSCPVAGATGVQDVYLKFKAGSSTGLNVDWWRFAPAAPVAQIDAAAVKQTIRGFGGATVFLPTTPLTQPDLDLLFGNGPGQIGLSLLRIRVSTDAAWRSLELANALGARARGAAVIATPWSPPAAMKTNNNLTAGSLKTTSYAEYATYLNDFANYMAANGASLYAISVQNEPDISVTYESCDWTPAQMLDFCKNNAGAITATKVIAPESFQFRKNISDPILNDATAAANIAIVGGHIYGAGLAAYPLAAAKGKEVWMTEHLDVSTDWAGALATGKEIHECMVTGNFSAYIWWYLRRYYGPLGEDSVVTKRGYVMAQFAKFVRPGFVRIDATASPTTGVYVSAYKGDKLVIVAINQTATAVTQTFSLTNGNVNRFTPWVTSNTTNVEAQSSIAVSGGSFTTSLPAESMTTFVADLTTGPTIVAPPQTQTVTAGGGTSLSVTATGVAPLIYQWLFNGTAIAGATSATYVIANPQPANTGDYAVIVSDANGSTTSGAAALLVKSAAPSDSRLYALSCRAVVGTGGDILIPGIIIGGTGSSQVVVRASGPALIAQGVSGTLAQPQLQLFQAGVANAIATNAGWDTGGSAATAALQAAFTASNLPAFAAGSRDCALLATLNAGSAYTAQVRGLGGAPTGVALIEVYELGASTARMTALSCRAVVGTGENILIPGIIILGGSSKPVIIRASGPALAAQGVGGTLAQPTLAIYNGNGVKIAENTGWNNVVNPATVSAVGVSVGLQPFPAGSADCAIFTTLPPRRLHRPGQRPQQHDRRRPHRNLRGAVSAIAQ